MQSAHKKALASILLGAASVSLLGCGGGSSGGDDGPKWPGFAFVSQEFILDKFDDKAKFERPSSADPAAGGGMELPPELADGVPAKMSGKIWMGFDDDKASGFGMHMHTEAMMELGGGKIDAKSDVFYMFSIGSKKHYACNSTSLTMEGVEGVPPIPIPLGKGCVYQDAPDVSKETFKDCVKNMGEKLNGETSEVDGLHKVRMSPPEEKGGAAYLYVDDKNMIQKLEVYEGDKLSQTVKGTAKAITESSFTPPEIFTEEFPGKFPGQKVPNMENAMAMAAGDRSIQALMECVGFKFPEVPEAPQVIV